MKLAPISLFVYNRLWHTKQTVEALKKNIFASESDLIIFSDGPKDCLESKKSILELRNYLKTITEFKSVRLVFRDHNYGLAKAIIAGVNEVIGEFGRIIVLEDDIISSRYFLQYMNEALNLYEKDDQVISAGAYMYPIKKIFPETFFLKGADCQGWATWKRGWDIFESNGENLLEKLQSKKMTKEFDLDGAYPYTKMLENQIDGKNSSWAVRWYASAFLKNKFSLYPRESLIYNCGFDGSGVNSGRDDYFNNTDRVENIRVKVNRVEIKENQDVRQSIIKHLKHQTKLGVRAFRYIKNIKKICIQKLKQ